MPATPPPADAEEIVVRPFADWLREQSKGHTHEELSEGLHDLIARVQDTGKKGVLQLTVTVAPVKGNETGALVVSDVIKLKLPEHERAASLFFPDKNGNLSRSDPNQLTFDSLREVPGTGVVDTTTGEIKEKKA